MVIFSSVLVALYGVFFKQESPVIYYAYAFFPVLFWEEVFAQRLSLVKGGKILFGHLKSGADVAKLVFATIGFFGLLQALVS